VFCARPRYSVLLPVPSALAQGLRFGTSLSFFDASARSIARSAFATASDLVTAWPPPETPVSSETDHFHKFRPMP
jgi:hypothetical protein